MSIGERIGSSLRIIGEMVRKEFYQVRQDRRMLGVSLVAPIVQVILLGYAATTDIKYTTMAVCDFDRTAESRSLVREFTTSGYFVHGWSVDLMEDLDPLLESGKASVALVIPEGYARRLSQRTPPQVQMIFDGADANTASILLNYANQIVATHTARASGTASGVPQVVLAGTVTPEPRVWFNPDLRSANFMVPGVVALVLMIVTMTLTALGIVKEKEIGTLEQLMVTPIKPYELILGKLIPFVIIGFLDVLVVLAIAHYWFEVPMRGSLTLLFSLSGLFILTTLGLGLFISTIAKSQQQAMLIAQFFFFMPFIYLSGFTFPISNMPPAIQYATYLIPLRYFLEIVRGTFLKGSGIVELWPQALALLWYRDRCPWAQCGAIQQDPGIARSACISSSDILCCGSSGECMRPVLAVDDVLFPPFGGFPKEGLAFLRKLKKNNNRPWFQAHKQDYEELVRFPMQCLIAELAQAMAGEAPELSFDPRKSIFRIYRDVRFSKNKAPYKTNIAASFTLRSRSGPMENPALYLHIGPGEVFVGGGLYMPASPQLKRLRSSIATEPEEFLAVVGDPGFKRMFGTLQGERLSRAPLGYPPDHPMIDHLKHKQFYVGVELEEKDVLRPKLVRDVQKVFSRCIPLIRWLTHSLH